MTVRIGTKRSKKKKPAKKFADKSPEQLFKKAANANLKKNAKSGGTGRVESEEQATDPTLLVEDALDNMAMVKAAVATGLVDHKVSMYHFVDPDQDEPKGTDDDGENRGTETEVNNGTDRRPGEEATGEGDGVENDKAGEGTKASTQDKQAGCESRVTALPGDHLAGQIRDGYRPPTRHLPGAGLTGVGDAVGDPLKCGEERVVSARFLKSARKAAASGGSGHAGTEAGASGGRLGERAGVSGTGSPTADEAQTTTTGVEGTNGEASDAAGDAGQANKNIGVIGLPAGLPRLAGGRG